MALVSVQADAARMGGGKSMGRQSSNVTQRRGRRTRRAVAERDQQRGRSEAGNAGGAAPPPPQRRSVRGWACWAAWPPASASHGWRSSLGLGAAFGNILLIGLLVLARSSCGASSRRARAAAAARPGGLAFEGAGGPGNAGAPAQYKPANVGNDASARPWEATAGRHFRRDASARFLDGRRSRRGRRQHDRLGAGRLAELGHPGGLRHRRLPCRGQAQLRDAAGRLGQERPRHAALDDDRHHAGRNPHAVGRARNATRAASRTRPRS